MNSMCRRPASSEPATSAEDRPSPRGVPLQKALLQGERSRDALAQRFAVEVVLPEPAHAPVRDAAYRDWLSARSGMTLVDLASAPHRAVDLALIRPEDGLARLCIALRRDDGGPDLVLADPFDRGTRWWLETRLRQAGRPRTRWFVAPADAVLAYWRRLTEEEPLWRPPAHTEGAAVTLPDTLAMRAPLRWALQQQADLLLWQPPQGWMARTAGRWTPVPESHQVSDVTPERTLDILRRYARPHASSLGGLHVGALELPVEGRTVRCTVHESREQGAPPRVLLRLPADTAPPTRKNSANGDSAVPAPMRAALTHPSGGLVVLALREASALRGQLHSWISESRLPMPVEAGPLLLIRTDASNAAPSNADASPPTPPPWTVRLPPDALKRRRALARLDTFVDTLRPSLIVIEALDEGALARWAVHRAAQGTPLLAGVTATSAPVAQDRLKAWCGPGHDALLTRVWRGTLARRSLPKVCPHCAGPAPWNERELRRCGLDPERVRDEGWMLAQAPGCDACDHTGILGEVQVHQWRPPLTDGAAPPTLREAALDAVAQGLVELQEACRAVALDE